ncbi:MAG: CaiB/BaiF CoA-transferase family protein [Gammaproteobacteria bacterium]
MQPLQGIRVLDFTTLLPGPLAALMLAEAGAEVIKIERPERGDEMRSYPHKFGADSVNFALLNRGKCSIAIDLKDPKTHERLRPLIESADVLLEQFRPGVMQRLGLHYEALATLNPRLVYCAITGFGQTGPKRDVAGHDLNYIADTGLLSLAADRAGTPVIPPALIADIAGGTYPAVINILLALRERERTGKGCYLDIAMTDHLFTFMYWALGIGQATGHWPIPGGELVTGGSPRYQIYRTADDRFVAAAPLEQKFWDNFCALIDLPMEQRDDYHDPAATIAAVAALIRAHDAVYWQARFAGQDVCCNIVTSAEAAFRDAHHRARGLFDAEVSNARGQAISAVPVPVAPGFRGARKKPYPTLGEANHLLEGEI